MTIFSDLLGTLFEMFVLCTLQYNKVSKKRVYISFVFWAILAILVVIMSQKTSAFATKLLVIFTIALCISKICYKTSLKRICICYIIYLLSISIGEVISFSILRTIFNDKISSLMQNPISFLLIIFFSKSLTLLFVLYVKYFFNKLHQLLGKAFLLTVTPLFTCFLVLCIESFRIYSKTVLSLNESIFSGLCTLFIIISSLCIIKLIEKYLKAKEIEHVTNLDLESISRSYEYLSKKVESQQRVQELYHDLKNHLIILKMKGGHSDYIDGLLNEIVVYEAFIDTGNSILNTLIYEKKKASSFNNISFETYINMNYITTIRDFDICTIFGNAIDNAIEACQKLDSVENRYIKVSAKIIRKFLIIDIENSKIKESNKNLNLNSTKSDEQEHGYGLKSIQRVVRKYNGELHISLKSTSFKLKIAIPITNIKYNSTYSNIA